MLFIGLVSMADDGVVIHAPSCAALLGGRGGSLICSKIVEGVERGDFVTLGQGRVVEGARQEVVQPAAQRQDRLPDMNQLRGPCADDVHAQQAVPPPLLAET